MLFNSFEFILFFLPVTLAFFYFLGRKGSQEFSIIWLVLASLFFYGWWNPAYLLLIIASILFNYSVGRTLSNSDNLSFLKHAVQKKSFLIFGISANLSLLAYYKYANFFIDNVNYVTGTDFQLDKIILPLAISFFTFQQITFLIDAYRGITKEYSFSHYCLFVTFFPQLIAGPIVHHQEMLPQFAKKEIYKFDYENISVGMTIFFIGLFKKVVIADGIAMHASSVFAMAENNSILTMTEAWGGAMAYTFQLYFDFSGYSDMAIGLARMFGIRLPLNFHSPYKAHNIIEFWHRWHITLSRFLRDYLYIPLGGNRKGKFRRYINLFITMLIGGLWHGASWTFVVWGALHGFYLIINHGFHAIRRMLGHDLSSFTGWGNFTSQMITFAAVIVGWVFFRAETFDGAYNMLYAMSGLNGIALPTSYIELLNNLNGAGNILSQWGIIVQKPARFDFFGGIELHILIALTLIVLYLPNTQQFMYNFRPAYEIYKGEIEPYRHKLFNFRFSFSASLLITMMVLITMLTIQTIQKSEFLYYDF
ncbi:MAG: MBOAT family protein [Deltaproteobacteria bacterium]|nr:MBOAT family protein [Deltaproteobacteria bacterium]